MVQVFQVVASILKSSRANGGLGKTHRTGCIPQKQCQKLSCQSSTPKKVIHIIYKYFFYVQPLPVICAILRSIGGGSRHATPGGIRIPEYAKLAKNQCKHVVKRHYHELLQPL